jgi:hypothetical protein
MQNPFINDRNARLATVAYRLQIIKTDNRDRTIGNKNADRVILLRHQQRTPVSYSLRPNEHIYMVGAEQ